MEQRPIPGQEPLAPPTADVARAYLEEIGLVHARREERIDRRRIAWFSLADAVVLSIYVTIAAFAIGEPLVGSSFVVLIAVFCIWMHLALERRESYGASGPPISKTRSVAIGFVVILMVVVVSGFVISFIGLALPVPVRVVPGVLALVILGVPAVREIRRSPRWVQSVQRWPLSGGTRLMTVGLGVLMAGGALAVAADPEQLWGHFLGLTLIVSYLAWSVAARISDRLPALGALWAWPQWTAFAVAGVAVAAIMLLQLLGGAASAAELAPLCAGAIALLFIGSAFLGGRDG